MSNNHYNKEKLNKTAILMSLFKSIKGKEEILGLYDQKLNELNIDFEYLKIDTSYGETNIITTGKPENPPMLLIHGSNGCAPISLETYPNLSMYFKVYAIDVLAQPNKSAETRLSMKDDAYGKWMNEVIDVLKLQNVTLAGFSFGGLVILKTLEFDESKIKEVYLTAPAYIVNGNPLIALFKIFIPMKRFMKTKKLKHIQKFLSEVFTEPDEFAIKYLSRVFLYFDMDFSPIPVISKRKAAVITTPLTIFAAEDDILFPGKKMIERAKKLFPSLESVTLLQDSKHVHSKKHNLHIEKIILKENH